MLEVELVAEDDGNVDVRRVNRRKRMMKVVVVVAAIRTRRRVMVS